jgi:hypothetical protein
MLVGAPFQATFPGLSRQGESGGIMDACKSPLFTRPRFSPILGALIKVSVWNLYRLDSFSAPARHDQPGRTNFIVIAFQIINIAAEQKTVNNLYHLFYTAGMGLASQCCVE